MKVENWNKNVAEVQAWLDTDDRGEVGQAIAMTITLGNNCGSDDLRSTYWTAIRSLGSPYESFPKAKRGRESSLPEEVDMNVISVKNAVRTAFAGISNAELILAVILPHGRTGGAFDSIESLAENFAGKAVTALTSAYKENRWDGTMNGEIPAMTPPVVKSTEGGQEEE
tara:strand:+ start:662 stop:1168 length:507 start_codon:yes stop_codon:yes gene_type:complete